MGPGRPKGIKKTGGRAKGTPNKLTVTVKQAFEQAFKDLQADPKQPYHLLNWAKENQTDFYKLASKLIPEEISGNVALTINVTKYIP